MHSCWQKTLSNDNPPLPKLIQFDPTDTIMLRNLIMMRRSGSAAAVVGQAFHHNASPPSQSTTIRFIIQPPRVWSFVFRKGRLLRDCGRQGRNNLLRKQFMTPSMSMN